MGFILRINLLLQSYYDIFCMFTSDLFTHTNVSQDAHDLSFSLAILVILDSNAQRFTGSIANKQGYQFSLIRSDLCVELRVVSSEVGERA